MKGIEKMQELMSYLNGIGFEGLSMLWLILPLMVFLVLMYIVYKIVSFIVSMIVVVVLLACFVGYFAFDSDVSWKNLSSLSNNTTDMLIVGKGDGCSVYAANRDVHEVIHIQGWKVHLGACEKANERLNILANKDGFKKLAKGSKDAPDCPMSLVTNRSQFYIEMALLMNTNTCETPQEFGKVIERLNKEEKEDKSTLKKLKDEVLDFVVKDIMK